MKFEIRERVHPNLKKYNDKDYKIALEFSKKALKEFGTFIRSIVLFGALARRQHKKPHDIDILIIVDDLRRPITPELVEAYRVIAEKLVLDTSPKIHLTTLKFSTFYDYVLKGDPIAINILRDGVPLLDTGFFDPLQFLLYQGKIRPTAEAISAYYLRAPKSLRNARLKLIGATLDLYWAVTDSAHACLMKLGYVPPSPMHIADMLEELHKKHLLEERYVKIMREFYKLMKMITYREIKHITGSEFERYYKEAERFVDRMKKIINHPQTKTSHHK